MTDHTGDDAPVDACRHCPLPFRLPTGQPHAQRWVDGVGWHGWTEPTNEQIKARMLARRALATSRKGPNA